MMSRCWVCKWVGEVDEGRRRGQHDPEAGSVVREGGGGCYGREVGCTTLGLGGQAEESGAPVSH